MTISAGAYAGLFHLELQPADSDDWRVIWEDIAVGECQINIEPAAARPINLDSTKQARDTP